MKKFLFALASIVLIHAAASEKKATYSKGIVLVGNTVACRVDVVGSTLTKSYSFQRSYDKDLVYLKRRIFRSPEANETPGPQETLTYF